MRRLALAMSVAALAGCDQAGLDLSAMPLLGGGQDETGQGIRTLSLLGGAVRVRGPEGYCVDQSASQARRGFAIMAGCALMSEEAAVMPSMDGLLTVQFGAEGSAIVAGAEAEMAAFLASSSGAALLAQDREADTAEVHTTENRVILRINPAENEALPGTQGPVWRGFMDANGRLVTVTVLSFERAPLSSEVARSLLELTMAEIAEVNASTDA